MKRHKFVKYGMGVRITKGMLATKYRFRSERYQGHGRPRRSDYDYKTILELQRDISDLRAKRIDKLLGEVFS